MKKAVVLLLALTLISGESYARFSKSKARKSGTNTGNQMGAQLSSDAQEGQGVNTTEYDSLEQSSQNNLDNSQKGQGVAYMMFGALAGAAAAKFDVCGTSGFSAYAACIAGGVLIGMAFQAKDSGDSFEAPIDTSWDNLCSYSSMGCAGGTPPNPYLDGQNVPSSDKLNILAEKFKDKGYGIDPKTGAVKTPDGKTVNPNDPASLSAALGAEGASSLMSEVSAMERAALDKVEEVKPSAVTAALGFEGGGGGAMGLPTGIPDDEISFNNFGLKGKNAASKLPRKPAAQVSGLSKNFNGDPIGVASDSIFIMMNRRYQLKHNQKTFLGAEVN